MADQDAAGHRPRRALFSTDDTTVDADGGQRPPAPPSRARRSADPWPEDDDHDGPAEPPRSTPEAPRSTPEPVAIQPATPPARDVRITPAGSTGPAFTPPGSGSEGLSMAPAAWGRPGPMPTDPRPHAPEHHHAQRSASSPPPMWQEPHRHVVDRRTRTGLLVSALALVVVACLSVGFAVWANQRPQTAGQAPTTGAPTPSPTPVLSEASMLTDADARAIDEDAGWKISLDTQGVTQDSPQVTCIVRDEAGMPIPEMTRLRTLTTANESRTAALHQADLYPTAEDAQRVYEARLGQLGGCAKQPVYLDSGWAPADLGNQSGGVVAVVQDEVATFHSLLLVRTGRMVNVIDVAQERKAVPYAGLVEAAAEVVNSQCGKTGGRCATDAESRESIPPLGTDQPGFLAGVDIPRITPAAGEWGGTPVESEFDVITSQCEGLDPATVSGPTSRAKVTYLLSNDPDAPPQYGFDEVVLTMEDAEAGAGLLERFDDSVRECPDNLRTADVSERTAIEGKVGKAEIRGSAYTVTQTVDDERLPFRIALVTIEEKVVYLLLPTTEDFDFTDEQWAAVAQRAAERTTQGS
ncbi:hypothetical protein GC722_10180 [Auraticoccus sp. F435]|uniref:Uncharacterized protein n=1 Tax=Auraticoccus cholistanensis TaxID=2656650 RepID=A0A6A9UY60_9ACTN|nr:hypothetical protein [Auraticoccus cholistanensis]MVA76387.1 hypothetical protein [Auraticoccus cholistanensis]